MVCLHDRGEELDFVGVFDSPCEGYAYNLYICRCGVILKEDVWDNKGLTLINLDGSIERMDGKNIKSSNQ